MHAIYVASLSLPRPPCPAYGHLQYRKEKKHVVSCNVRWTESRCTCRGQCLTKNLEAFHCTACPESAPFLVWTGTAGDENAQFYVCCEQSVLTESKNVRDAIIDLMATYYVFDIAYPKAISAIMLFFSIVFLSF